MTDHPALSPSRLFDLSGQVAVVTGASRGIGESIARTLAAAGAQVVVSSRKLADCEAVAASIRASGGKATALACHIGEIAQIDALFAQVEQQFGRLDVLVNNAATNPHYGPIWETDVSAFQKTVDVNIRGYYFMSAGGVKLMMKNGAAGGAIVNTASVNGVVPGLLQGIYSITKSAVIAMTKAYARECAPLNIRVNALLLRNTSVVNMLDGCAISIPCHEPGELPRGLLIWQSAMRDDTVLNIALQAESVLAGTTGNP